MKKHSYLGGIGSSFIGLCCAGTPLVLAFLSGIGLGFLINDFILFPLLAIGLGFMFYALEYNKKHHSNNKPMGIAMIASLLVIAGIWLKPIIWFGVVGLLIATIGDFMLIRKCKTC